MRLARVVGTCTATAKVDSLVGHRLLLIQPLDFELEEEGGLMVAVDAVRSDRGQVVWWVGSREAANSLPDPFTPVDCAVVGVVDELDLDDEMGRRRVLPREARP